MVRGLGYIFLVLAAFYMDTFSGLLYSCGPTSTQMVIGFGLMRFQPIPYLPMILWGLLGLVSHGVWDSSLGLLGWESLGMFFLWRGYWPLVTPGLETLTCALVFWFVWEVVPFTIVYHVPMMQCGWNFMLLTGLVLAGMHWYGYGTRYASSD